MPVINGLDPNQISFSSLEEAIDTENEVCFSATFANVVRFAKYG